MGAPYSPTVGEPHGNHQDFQGFELRRASLWNLSASLSTTYGATPPDGAFGFQTVASGSPSQKHMVFYDTAISSDVVVPRLDCGETLTAPWAFNRSGSNPPFTCNQTLPSVGSTATMVTNLNANYLKGYLPDTSATANTVAQRDSSGILTGADPVGSTDLVNLRYLRAELRNADDKGSVRCSTVASLPAGSFSANVWTASANGAFAAQDGITCALNDLIFVGYEGGAGNPYYLGTAHALNGLFKLIQLGDASNPAKLQRATNADVTSEVSAGMFFFISEGTNQGNSKWSLFTDDPIYLRTDAPDGLAAVAASGGSLSAGTYYYRIAAVDYNGSESATTLEVSGTTSGGNLTLNLSWNSFSEAASYRIYRSTSSGSYGASSLAGTTTGTTFSDTGVSLSSGQPKTASALQFAKIGANTFYSQGNGIDISGTVISVLVGGSTTYTQYGILYHGTTSTLTSFQGNGILKVSSTGAPSVCNGGTNRVTFWSDANTISSSANLAWNGNTLDVVCATNNYAVRVSNGTATGGLYVGSQGIEGVHWITSTNHGFTWATNNSGPQLALLPAGTVIVGSSTALASGVLQVYGGLTFNGAQTIQTSTGTLTIQGNAGLTSIGGSLTLGNASTQLSGATAGRLAITHVGGTAPLIQLFGGATQYAALEGNLSGAFALSSIAGDIVLRPNNAEAARFTTTGNLKLAPVTGGPRYLILDGNDTLTGNLVIQAGAGSAGYGGSIIAYSHSHATRPGWITAGISVGSGGKFSVNNQALGGGTDVLTVDASGNATLEGDITLTGASTITTTTGNLTLSTSANNGNILLSPNGTGITAIGGTITGYGTRVFVEARQDADATRVLMSDNQNTGSSAYGGIGIGAYGNSWVMRTGSAAANGNTLEFVTDVTSPSTSKLSLSTAGVLSIAALTQKSILFAGASGAVSQDNSNFQYDSTTATLGVGTAADARIAGYFKRAGAVTAYSSGLVVEATTTSSTASIRKEALQITSTGTWNGASAVNVGIQIDAVSGGTTNWALYNNTAANVYLGTGNVGVGISPTFPLHVSGRTQIKGAGTTSSTYGLDITDSSGADNFWVRDDGVSYLKGNLGIGETTPAQKLVVKDTSSAPYVSLISGDSALNGILFGKVSNTVAGQIIYNNSTNMMSFVTNTATAFTVSSAGVVNLASLTASSLVQTDASKNLVSSSDLPAAATIGSAYIYRVGGTDVSLADGGTNKSITAVAGAVVWCDSDSFELTAAGSTGQMLRSAGTSSPTWSTATYPNTATVGDIMTCSSTNVWGSLAAGSADYFIKSNGTGPVYFDLFGTGNTWTGSNTFSNNSTVFRSHSAYSTPPTVLLKFDFQYNSSATIKTLAYIEAGKENATDGNDAGYWAVYTRPNGGSPTKWLNISSAGVINLPQLTASMLVQTDASKNLVSSNSLPSGTTLSGARITRTNTTTIGDGAASSFTVAHGAGDKAYVIPCVKQASDGEVWGLKIAVDNTNIVVTFGFVPTTNQFILSWTY